MSTHLNQYVIYQNAKDRLGPFTVRRWQIVPFIPERCEARDFPTLEAARASLPRGVVNIGRSPLDDPVVVEVWL